MVESQLSPEDLSACVALFEFGMKAHGGGSNAADGLGGGSNAVCEAAKRRSSRLKAKSTIIDGRALKRTRQVQCSLAPRNKRRKLAPPKDPNAPKRPLVSGYVLFCVERGPGFRAENPRLSAARNSGQKVMKRLGAEWKKMDAASKQGYDDRVAAAKKEYPLKVAQYEQSEHFKQYQQRVEQWRRQRHCEEDNLERCTEL